MIFLDVVKSPVNALPTTGYGQVQGNSHGADSGLIDALSYAYSALDHLVYLDPSDVFQAADYQQQLDIVIDVLRLPQVFIANDAVTRRIHESIARMKRIGDARRDPAGSAQAFQDLFSALGELAHELPSPVDGSAEIFAEAEEFFESLRLELQPPVQLDAGQWTIVGSAS